MRRPTREAPDELGVRLVEDDDRRRPAVVGGVARQSGQRAGSRSGHRVRPAPSGCSGCTARPARRDRAAVRTAWPGRAAQPSSGRSPRDRHDRRAALLRADAVHRIGRRRERRRELARGEERLGDQVEDLVGAGADQELVGADAVAGGCRRDEPAVVRRRVLGERRVEPAGREELSGEGRRRRRRVQVEADDRPEIDAVARRDLLVGRLPGVADAGAVGELKVTGVGLIARSSKRISTASRWASRPSASARAAIVSRMPARPSRVIRWIWLNLPKVSTASAPEARARPPVGRTWFAPVA